MKTQMNPPDPTESKGKFRKAAEGLYQQKSSGAYYARFRYKGERIMQRLGEKHHPCTSLPEAKRLLRDLKDRTERTDVAASKKTLHAIIKEYKAVMSFGADTKKYKIQYLDELKEAFPSSKKVSDIKKSDILRFLANYDERLAPATINKVITLTRDVFQYAVDDKAIAVSPVDGVKYRKQRTTEKRLIPSWEEFTSIVASIRAQKYADTAGESGDLIEFMGIAGLGQGECSGLTWGDVNFQTGIITIIRKKTGFEFSIPIYPQVRTLLERMNADRGENRDPKEEVFKVKNPKKALEAACKRLELPIYTARSFRKMFITRCLELGIDPQTIAKWQGHRDGGTMVLKVYGSVSRKHQENMAALLIAPTPSDNVIPTESAAF
jgi:integrase